MALSVTLPRAQRYGTGTLSTTGYTNVGDTSKWQLVSSDDDSATWMDITTSKNIKRTLYVKLDRVADIYKSTDIHTSNRLAIKSGSRLIISLRNTVVQNSDLDDTYVKYAPLNISFNIMVPDALEGITESHIWNCVMDAVSFGFKGDESATPQARFTALLRHAFFSLQS